MDGKLKSRNSLLKKAGTFESTTDKLNLVVQSPIKELTKVECKRFHIDEYDEYYSRFLLLSKELMLKTDKISRLEKEVVNLKQMLRQKDSSVSFANQLENKKSLNQKRNKHTTDSNERGDNRIKKTKKNKKIDIFSSEGFTFDRCRDAETQTITVVDIARRSTIILPIKESLSEDEETTSSVSMATKEYLEPPSGSYTASGSIQKIQRFRKMSRGINEQQNCPLEEEKYGFTDMEFDLKVQMGRRKKSNSVFETSKLAKISALKYEQELIKLYEDNLKLEDEILGINKMKVYSEENNQLRSQLLNAELKFTEKEKILLNEKDQQIQELSNNLLEREEKYKSLLKSFNQIKEKLSEEDRKEQEKIMDEKEAELERINYKNAEYRAQLIELKISMSKTKDLSRFCNILDDHQVMVYNSQMQLDEAKEKILDLMDKVKEQDSIIQTLISQTEYYKEIYQKEQTY